MSQVKTSTCRGLHAPCILKPVFWNEKDRCEYVKKHNFDLFITIR